MKKKKIESFVVISNDKLGDKVGEYAICPHCYKKHIVKYADKVLSDGSRMPSKILGFVQCGKSSYVVAINELLWIKSKNENKMHS